MKWAQFFFIMAAAYIAPRASYDVAVILAAIFTAAGLVATWRKE